MSPLFRNVVFSLVVLAVAAALFYGWRQRRAAPVAPGIAAGQREKVVGRAERPDSRSPSLLGAEREESLRAVELERLKGAWMAFYRENPPSGIITSAHHALEKETVEGLLCSEELLELIEFLKRYRRDPRAYFDRAIAELFRSPRAAEARESLVALSVDNGGIPLRQHWSFDAGQGCPAEEFDTFCEALRDQRAINNAIYGRSMALAGTDPAAAVSLTLEGLGNGEPSTRRSQSLRRLFENDLPAGTDFAALEKLLPPDSAEEKRGPIREGRYGLLKNWARIDPAAAAEYVMASPDRIDPSRVHAISEEVVKATPAAAVDWVQHFPEGPYFDHAVRGVIPHIADGYPEEAGELAARIGDPEIREECLKRVAGAGRTDAR